MLIITYKIFNKDNHYLSEEDTTYHSDWTNKQLKDHLIAHALERYPETLLGFIVTDTCMYWNPLIISVNEDIVMEPSDEFGFGVDKQKKIQLVRDTGGWEIYRNDRKEMVATHRSGSDPEMMIFPADDRDEAFLLWVDSEIKGY
jgi:hypothetical protein